MLNIRATQSDLFSGKPGETRVFCMDRHSILLARQMIYNRGLKYPGLKVELIRKEKIFNNEDLFVVECKRITYGKSIDGFEEPKEYVDYDYTTVKARRRARKEADKANQQTL